MDRVILVTEDEETSREAVRLLAGLAAEVLVLPAYDGTQAFSLLLYDIGSQSDWLRYLELKQTLTKPVRPVCGKAQWEALTGGGALVYGSIPKPLDNRLTDTVSKLLQLPTEAIGAEEMDLRRAVKRDFLWHVIWGITPRDNASLREVADHVGFNPDRLPLLPIYITIRAWANQPAMPEKAQKGNYLLEQLDELLPKDSELITLSPTEFFAGVYTQAAAPSGDLVRLLQEVSHYGQAVLGCSVCSYLGKPIPLQQLSGECAALFALDRENVTLKPVCDLSSLETQPWDSALFDVGKWSLLLEVGQYDTLMEDISNRILHAAEHAFLTRRMLERFCAELAQLFAVKLQREGLWLGQVLDTRVYTEMFSQASSSVENVLTWAYWVVGALCVYLDKAEEKPEGPLDGVLRYIDAHIAENLSREALARQAHFSPSHLLRLFNRELGMSITDYTARRRMELAAMLLESTKLPVSRIAEMVGYTSCSHFFSKFRAVYGSTPAAYRREKDKAE